MGMTCKGIETLACLSLISRCSKNEVSPVNHRDKSPVTRDARAHSI